MNHGKIKCEALKAIRKKIAMENGIDYEPVFCNYQGTCSGTCPMCEKELEYLENQIKRKKSAGKNIAILGIAAGLSLLTPQVGLAQNSESATKIEQSIGDEYVKVTGTLRDSAGEYLPGVLISEKNNPDKNKITVSNMDGKFEFTVNKGATIIISALGYKEREIEVSESVNLEIVLDDDTGDLMTVGLVVPVKKAKKDKKNKNK